MCVGMKNILVNFYSKTTSLKKVPMFYATTACTLLMKKVL